MLNIKNILINDTSVSEVLSYIRQAGYDNYGYVANSHLDRLLFITSFIVNNFSSSSKILEIGSFPYFIPGYLSLRGFENINTIDINRPDDFPFAPRWKIHSLKFDIEEKLFPFEDETFDLVLLLEVFEHLYRRPNQVFHEIERTLKPGGTLIISTPNGGILRKFLRFLLTGKFDKSMYDFSMTYENVGHFDHIREYSVREIKSYLKHFAFSINIILKTFYPTEISNDNKIYRTESRRTFKGILKKLFGEIYGDCIFIIARKLK